MGSNPEAGVVAGVFADEEHAADAVHKLIEAHYDPHHEIEVISAHRREHANVPIWERFNYKRNAPLGALIGAVLAGTGVAIAGLTTGPFTMVAAGPFFAALEAAFGGGCAGFAIGALMSLESPDQGPVFENTDIHDGVVWVGVQAKGERGERARDILATAGARHFTS
jgi:hypothetical protein